MARERVVKMIQDSDGVEHRYEFSQFNTTKSLKTLARLTKLFGEPLTVAFSAFLKNPDPKLLTKDIDGDALARAVKILIERMDEDEVSELVKTVVASESECDHKPVLGQYELLYQGDMKYLLKALMAGLEVQYGNFIGAVTVRMPVAAKMGGIGVVG